MKRISRAKLIDTAIGCSRGEGLSCSAYPWVSCCQTRKRICEVLGVPFKTPPLAEIDRLDDGYIHLFGPTSGREPRVSAGCFKAAE